MKKKVIAPTGMFVLFATALLAGCGSLDLDHLKSGSSESTGSSVDCSQHASEDLCQFEAELLATIDQGATIVSIDDPNSFPSAQLAVNFDSGKTLVISRVSNGSSSQDDVFKGFQVSQGSGAPAGKSAKCLAEGIRATKDAGFELQSAKELFADQTLFLGYSDGLMVTFDVTTGECYASVNRG